jgi:hypothetical protein
MIEDWDEDAVRCIRCGRPLRVSHMGQITQCGCHGGARVAVLSPGVNQFASVTASPNSSQESSNGQ